MSESLDSFHMALRYSHVALGFAGLILFWIPVFATKGGKLHIRCGRAFVWITYYVGGTALVASLWALLDTGSFIGMRAERIGEKSLPFVFENFRFLFSILLYLSLATLAGVHYGVRLVQTRRDHAQLRSPGVLGLEAAFGVVSLMLVAFGVWNLYLGYSGQHLLPSSGVAKYWLHVALGLFGMFGVWTDLKYIFTPPPSRMSWWYAHMEAMLSVGVGYHTAFAVFGANRLLGLDLPGAWKLLPWVLPAAIGVPAIAMWVQYYQRKFDDLPAKNSEA